MWLRAYTQDKKTEIQVEVSAISRVGKAVRVFASWSPYSWVIDVEDPLAALDSIYEAQANRRATYSLVCQQITCHYLR